MKASILLFVLNSLQIVSSASICSTNSILSIFTDPACSAWCKVKLCSYGECRTQVTNKVECFCDACTFDWFSSSSSSSSSSNYNTGNNYAPGSAGEHQAVGFNEGLNYNQQGFNNAHPQYNPQMSYGSAGEVNQNPNVYRTNQYDPNVPQGYGNQVQTMYPRGYRRK